MGEGGSPGPRLGETAEKGEPNSVVIVQDFIPFAPRTFLPFFTPLRYLMSRGHFWARWAWCRSVFRLGQEINNDE